MKYLCLFLICISCQLSPPIQNKTALPTAFTAIEEEEATPFTLSNPANLDLPAGPSKYHQQGIQQLPDGGWAVSGSGAEQGYLYFTTADGNIHTIFKMPEDLQLSASARQQAYNHPGGFQITDNILAVGVEYTEDRKASASRVVLLDVSDPRASKHLPHLDIVREAKTDRIMTAGAVALVALENTYLIIVGNWDSKRLDFYQTSSKNLLDGRTTVSDCLGSWEATQEFASYQNINVYGNQRENLHLIGLYSENREQDYADLWTLDCSDWSNIQMNKIDQKHFRGSGDGPKFVHGAGTSYDAKTKQLQVYSVEAHMHENKIRCSLWQN